MKLAINLGDVLRALDGTASHVDEDCARVARLLGFGWSSRSKPNESTPPREPKASKSAEGTFELPRQVVTEASESWLNSVSYETKEHVPQWYVDAATLPKVDEDELERHASIEPLFPNTWLRSLLRDTLLSRSTCNSIDVERLVEIIAQRAPINTLPRQLVSRLRYGAQVVVDVHASMAPYREDQQLVIEEMLRLLGRDQVEVLSVDGQPAWSYEAPPGATKSLPRQRKGWGVLALTNLGAGPLGSGPSGERQAKWLDFAQQTQQKGHSIVALVPGSVDRIPIAIRRCLTTIPWDAPALRGKFERSYSSEVNAAEIKDRSLRRIARCDPDVAKLAKYLSLASRIPRALLRQARLQFCPKADASLEADLWFSSIVQTRTADSILLYPEAAGELRQQLVDAGELPAAWSLLERFHEFRPELVRLQERLTWLSLRQDEESQREFDASIATVIKSIVEQGRTGLGQWALSALKRLPIGRQSHRANLLRAVAKERVSGRSMPSSNPAERQVWDEARSIIANNSELVRIGIFHSGNELRLSEPPEAGSEILSISAQNVRKLIVGTSPIQWSADVQPPRVTVPTHSSVAIRVEGRGAYELQPVKDIVAPIEQNCRNSAGYVAIRNSAVAGPAFAIDRYRIVTTQRTLAIAQQQAQHTPSGIEIQLMTGGRVRARSAAGSISANKDLQMADELVVLDLLNTENEFASIDFDKAAVGATVYATSCSASGVLRWARFEVEEVESVGLRLQPLAMLRWLELQTWSGAMLFDSETGRCVGFAVAGAGGLAIKVPEKTVPVSLHEKLKRERPQRVRISYEVHVAAATAKKELPFVVGIIGDLCGDSTTVRSLRNRRFLSVDRDNLNARMKELGVWLSLEVPNAMGQDKETVMLVNLQFESLEDFHPTKVAQQVPALNQLLAMRSSLAEWRSLFERDAIFEELIQQNIYFESESKEFAMSTIGTGAATNSAEPHDSSKIRLNIDRLLSQLKNRMPTDRAERMVAPIAQLFERTGLQRGNSARALCEEQIRSIDGDLNRQVAAILHHPRFQKLEASWRGVRYLVANTETGPDLKIKLLQATKSELMKDFERSEDFDQSTIFKFVYQECIGTFGGEPFGALLADFYFDNSAADVQLMQNLSLVGSSAFCPVLSAAAPGLLGLEGFEELRNPRDLQLVFQSVAYQLWNRLRGSDESRYLVLTLPRALARLPYSDSTLSVDEFPFQEIQSQPGGQHDEFCWMNTAYLYAFCLTRAFSTTGQCIAIRGVESGGRLDNLPTYIVAAEDGGLDMKCPTEIQISDRRETELSQLGLLPLCHYMNTDYAVFFGAATVHQPKRFEDQDATASAQAAARLPYIMATSRFAQTLMVMSRDRIGSLMEVDDLERSMQAWLNSYVAPEGDLTARARAVHPLRNASIRISEVPGKPGFYSATLHLTPFLLYEDITVPSRLQFSLPLPK